MKSKGKYEAHKEMMKSKNKHEAHKSMMKSKDNMKHTNK